MSAKSSLALDPFFTVWLLMPGGLGLPVESRTGLEAERSELLGRVKCLAQRFETCSAAPNECFCTSQGDFEGHRPVTAAERRKTLATDGPQGSRQDLMDDPEGSQGFCLLNNVAIGAAYARGSPSCP